MADAHLCGAARCARPPRLTTGAVPAMFISALLVACVAGSVLGQANPAVRPQPCTALCRFFYALLDQTGDGLASVQEIVDYFDAFDQRLVWLRTAAHGSIAFGRDRDAIASPFKIGLILFSLRYLYFFPPSHPRRLAAATSRRWRS